MERGRATAPLGVNNGCKVQKQADGKKTRNNMFKKPKKLSDPSPAKLPSERPAIDRKLRDVKK